MKRGDFMLPHDNEVLTDNTKINYCKQCKDCAYWGNGQDPFSNAYDKCSCDFYPFPSMKPSDVIHNRAKCEYWTLRAKK